MPAKHRKYNISGSYVVVLELYAVAIACRWMISGALYEMNGVRPTRSTERICAVLNIVNDWPACTFNPARIGWIARLACGRAALFTLACSPRYSHGLRLLHSKLKTTHLP